MKRKRLIPAKQRHAMDAVHRAISAAREVPGLEGYCRELDQASLGATIRHARRLAGLDEATGEPKR